MNQRYTRTLVLVFLLCSFAGSLLFGSRHRCTDYNKETVRLTPDTREWITYQAGQTILFEDSSGNTQTLQIIQFADTIERYFQGDECPPGKQEVITALLPGNTAQDSILIRLERYQELTVSINKRFLINYTVDINSLYPADDTTNYKLSESVTLSGKTFNTVLYANCLACEKNKLTAVYVAKGTGLVAFVENATLWTLK